MRTFRSSASGTGTTTDNRQHEARSNQALPIDRVTRWSARQFSGRSASRDSSTRRSSGSGPAFFLSRPRRLGKSLFLDTLKELFAGLYIHDRWTWSVCHPVVWLSFGSDSFKEPGRLDEDVTLQLEFLDEEAEFRPAR